MKQEETRSPCKCNQIIAWVSAGALLAPLIFMAVSYLLADPSMRSLPVLFLIFFAGALSGRISHLVYWSLRSPKQRKPLAWAAGILVYGVLLFLFYYLVRLGPF
jgi:hypothetical protein